MARVLLELTPALAHRTGLAIHQRHEVETVTDLINILAQALPELADLMNPHAEIAKHVRLFVNQVNVHHLDTGRIPLVDGDHISLVPLTARI